MTSTQTQTPVPFGPPSLQQRSRDLYVDNETDTDQWSYTDAQDSLGSLLAHLAVHHGQRAPAYLFTHIVPLSARFTDAKDDEAELRDVARYIHAAYHDALWITGEHPYDDTLLEWVGTSDLADDPDVVAQATEWVVTHLPTEDPRADEVRALAAATAATITRNAVSAHFHDAEASAHNVRFQMGNWDVTAHFHATYRGRP